MLRYDLERGKRIAELIVETYEQKPSDQKSAMQIAMKLSKGSANPYLVQRAINSTWGLYIA